MKFKNIKHTIFLASLNLAAAVSVFSLSACSTYYDNEKLKLDELQSNLKNLFSDLHFKKHITDQQFKKPISFSDLKNWVEEKIDIPDGVKVLILSHDLTSDKKFLRLKLQFEDPLWLRENPYFINIKVKLHKPIVNKSEVLDEIQNRSELDQKNETNTKKLSQFMNNLENSWEFKENIEQREIISEISSISELNSWLKTKLTFPEGANINLTIGEINETSQAASQLVVSLGKASLSKTIVISGLSNSQQIELNLLSQRLQALSSENERWEINKSVQELELLLESVTPFWDLINHNLNLQEESKKGITIDWDNNLKINEQGQVDLKFILSWQGSNSRALTLYLSGLNNNSEVENDSQAELDINSETQNNSETKANQLVNELFDNLPSWDEDDEAFNNNSESSETSPSSQSSNSTLVSNNDLSSEAQSLDQDHSNDVTTDQLEANNTDSNNTQNQSFENEGLESSTSVENSNPSSFLDQGDSLKTSDTLAETSSEINDGETSNTVAATEEEVNAETEVEKVEENSELSTNSEVKVTAHEEDISSSSDTNSNREVNAIKTNERETNNTNSQTNNINEQSTSSITNSSNNGVSTEENLQSEAGADAEKKELTDSSSSSQNSNLSESIGAQEETQSDSRQNSNTSEEVQSESQTEESSDSDKVTSNNEETASVSGAIETQGGESGNQTNVNDSDTSITNNESQGSNLSNQEEDTQSNDSSSDNLNPNQDTTSKENVSPPESTSTSSESGANLSSSSESTNEVDTVSSGTDSEVDGNKSIESAQEEVSTVQENATDASSITEGEDDEEGSVTEGLSATEQGSETEIVSAAEEDSETVSENDEEYTTEKVKQKLIEKLKSHLESNNFVTLTEGGKRLTFNELNDLYNSVKDKEDKSKFESKFSLSKTINKSDLGIDDTNLSSKLSGYESFTVKAENLRINSSSNHSESQLGLQYDLSFSTNSNTENSAINSVDSDSTDSQAANDSASRGRVDLSGITELSGIVLNNKTKTLNVSTRENNKLRNITNFTVEAPNTGSYTAKYAVDDSLISWNYWYLNKTNHEIVYKINFSESQKKELHDINLHFFTGSRFYSAAANTSLKITFDNDTTENIEGSKFVEQSRKYVPQAASNVETRKYLLNNLKEDNPKKIKKIEIKFKGENQPRYVSILEIDIYGLNVPEGN